MLNKTYQQGNTFLPYLILVVIAGLITTNLWLYFWSQKEITPLKNQPVTTTTDPLADWQTYTNTNYGFSLKYPPTPWITREEPVTYQSTGFQLSILNPTTPKPEIESPFKGSYIEIFTVTGQTDPLSAYIKTKNFAPDVAQVMKLQKDWNFSGLSAKEYCGIPGLFSYCETIFIKDNKLFVIGEVEGVSDDIYHQILSTFRLTDSLSDWQTYTNNKSDYSFSYPKSWVTDDCDEGDRVVIVTPEQIPCGGDWFGDGFVVTHLKDKSERENRIIALKKILKNPQETTITIAGNNATRITGMYLKTVAGDGINIPNDHPADQVFVTDNSNEYLITNLTFSVTSPYVQEFEHLLATFRFTDEPVIKIPDDWKNYTDNQIGFSFAYPNAWKLATENGDPSVIASLFYQPIEEAYNLDGGISVYVSVHEANGQSLDDWFHQNEEYSKEKIQQKVAYMKQEGSGSLKASDIITNFQSTTIDSTPAIAQYTKELKPTYIEGGASTRKEYYFKKGDKIISIIGQTSTGSQAQGMLNLFDQFVATFKFNK